MKTSFNTKQEAILAARKFIKKVNKLEKKYNLSFNSDSGDVYLSCSILESTYVVHDIISLGWKGDGSGIKVTEPIKDKEFYKKQALSKLTDEERDALGL